MTPCGTCVPAGPSKKTAGFPLSCRASAGNCLRSEGTSCSIEIDIRNCLMGSDDKARKRLKYPVRIFPTTPAIIVPIHTDKGRRGAEQARKVAAMYSARKTQGIRSTPERVENLTRGLTNTVHVYTIRMYMHGRWCPGRSVSPKDGCAPRYLGDIPLLMILSKPARIEKCSFGPPMNHACSDRIRRNQNNSNGLQQIDLA